MGEAQLLELLQETRKAQPLLPWRQVSLAPIEWDCTSPTAFPLRWERPDFRQGAGAVEKYFFRGLAKGVRKELAPSLLEGFVRMFPLAPGGKGFIAAGGKLANVYAKHAHRGDIDMYAVGLTPQEAEARVDAFASKLLAAEAAAPAEDERRITLYRTANCVTLLVPCGAHATLEIQFITTTFRTAAEVLNGFDNWACAVAFDGTTVLFTAGSAFAHHTGCFPVELNKASASFERRLVKYVNLKGFALILPEMGPVAQIVPELGADDTTDYPEDCAEALSLGVKPGETMSRARLVILAAKRNPDLLGSGPEAMTIYRMCHWRRNTSEFPTASEQRLERNVAEDEGGYGALTYHDAEDIARFNVRQLHRKSASPMPFLVYSRDERGDWRPHLGKTAADLQKTLMATLKATSWNRRYFACAKHLVPPGERWNQLCALAVRSAFTWVSPEEKEANARWVEELAQEIAERAWAQADAARGAMVWRTSEAVTANLRPVFARDHVDARDWYGKYWVGAHQ